MIKLQHLITNSAWERPLKMVLQSSKKLESFLNAEIKSGKTVFPPKEDIFNALNSVSPKDINIVILGQDPYHGQGQAHGLAFSVNKGIKIPPSLRNIYKELYNDLGIIPPKHGFLKRWSKEGVLLLNAALTVESGCAGSHQKIGWDIITDAVIKHINTLEQPIVFMLWGAAAEKKETLFNNPNHLILKAPHPSPLSAHRGFIGCKHFSKANLFVKKHHKKCVNWDLNTDI